MDYILRTGSVNDDFEVGDFLSGEDASPHSVAVPQFLYEGEDFAKFLPAAPASFQNAPSAPSRVSPNPWPPQLVIDLALGIEPEEEILNQHNIDREHYDRLLQIPAFRRELASTMRDLRDNGVTFARKAAIQAESYLVDLDNIVRDSEVTAATRLEAIRSVVKWGRLEPKEEKNSDSSGNVVNLQINFTP